MHTRIQFISQCLLSAINVERSKRKIKGCQGVKERTEELCKKDDAINLKYTQLAGESDAFLTMHKIVCGITGINHRRLTGKIISYK